MNGSSSSPRRRRCVWLFLQAGGARGPLSTAVARGPRPLPTAVRWPRRPFDVVARLAAPRSGREDADLSEKQRNPAVGQQHVHQVSGSRFRRRNRRPRGSTTAARAGAVLCQVPCDHAVNNRPRGFQVLWRAESLAEAWSSDWECRLPSMGDRVHNLERSKLAPLLQS